MTLINPEIIFIERESNVNKDERILFAAILNQAWSDAFERFKDCETRKKPHRCREAELARAFLTGNYSRERFQTCCEAININPNCIIQVACQQYWGKDISPRYF